MSAPDTGSTPVPPGELKPGQFVYVEFFRRWFLLAAEPKTHRWSPNLFVLHFDGLRKAEYRHVDAPMYVRDKPAT